MLIARNVDELHGDNHLNKDTALTEKGEMVNGRGDTPNQHDILTGSDSMGMAFPALPLFGGSLLWVGHLITGTMWALFHIFIVVLQAFIFMMLTLVYLGQAHEGH